MLQPLPFLVKTFTFCQVQKPGFANFFANLKRCNKKTNYRFEIAKTFFPLEVFFFISRLDPFCPISYFTVLIQLHGARRIQARAKEALQDVSKLLDGCTYPSWKMTCIAHYNNFLASAKGNRLSSRTRSRTYRWWSLICWTKNAKLFYIFLTNPNWQNLIHFKLKALGHCKALSFALKALG